MIYNAKVDGKNVPQDGHDNSTTLDLFSEMSSFRQSVQEFVCLTYFLK